MGGPAREFGTVRAAQYLRMSTEHQRYSTDNQAAAIAEYAVRNGYQIVATYADEGISGLSIRRREGLKRLLGDCMSGQASFDVILVYDVSRWGRFQNPDQAAHYEFLCAQAGYGVVYCAEAFQNDGGTASALLKTLKRVMAAEYSRDLSERTSRAHRFHAARGYWQGGPAGYGFRRMVVDEAGRPILPLERGEFKAVHNYRTVLVHGPPEELTIVRRIYRAYVDGGLGARRIAAFLNREGVPVEGGGVWTSLRVDQILTNPKYVGTVAYEKSKGALGGPRKRRPRAEWTLLEGACPPIVPRRLFDAAQALRAARAPVGKAKLLDDLRRLYALHGEVRASLLLKTPGFAAPSSYAFRFGSLTAACRQAGLPDPPSRVFRITREEALYRLARVYEREGRLSHEIVRSAPDAPSISTLARLFGGLRNAFAEVGYVQLTRAQKTSALGQARMTAGALRLKTILGAPPPGL